MTEMFQQKKNQMVTQLFLNSLHFTTQTFKMEQTYTFFFLLRRRQDFDKQTLIRLYWR